MSLTMTMVIDDWKVKRYGLEEAMDISNLVGMHNFSLITGIEFDEALEGFEMTAAQRGGVLGAVRALQIKGELSEDSVNHFLNLIMNAGEYVDEEPALEEDISLLKPKGQSGGPFGGGMNP